MLKFQKDWDLMQPIFDLNFGLTGLHLVKCHSLFCGHRLTCIPRWHESFELHFRCFNWEDLSRCYSSYSMKRVLSDLCQEYLVGGNILNSTVECSGEFSSAKKPFQESSTHSSAPSTYKRWVCSIHLCGESSQEMDPKQHHLHHSYWLKWWLVWFQMWTEPYAHYLVRQNIYILRYEEP